MKALGQPLNLYVAFSTLEYRLDRQLDDRIPAHVFSRLYGIMQDATGPFYAALAGALP